MTNTIPVYHAKSCGVFLAGGVCNCKAQVISRVYCPNERCPNHIVGWIPRTARPKRCPFPGCQRTLQTKNVVAPVEPVGEVGA